MSFLHHRRRKSHVGGGFDKTGLIMWQDFAGDTENKHDVGTLDATLVNGAGYTTGPFSDSNGALDCTVTSDKHAKVSDDAALTLSGDFSIVMWLDDEGGNPSYCLGKYGSAGQRSFYLYFQGSTFDRAQFVISDDGTNLESETTGVGDYPDGSNWYHFAVTYDLSTNTINFYRNGSVVHTGTYTTETGAMFDSTADYTIGALDATSAADVNIARHSLWSRELTSDEISTIYNSGNDTKYADL